MQRFKYPIHNGTLKSSTKVSLALLNLENYKGQLKLRLQSHKDLLMQFYQEIKITWKAKIEIWS